MYHERQLAKGIINNNNYAQFSHLQALHHKREPFQSHFEFGCDAASRQYPD